MADVTCPLTREDRRTLLSDETLPPKLRAILETQPVPSNLHTATSWSGQNWKQGRFWRTQRATMYR